MSEPTPTDVMLARTLRRAAELRRRRRVAVGTVTAAVAALAIAIPVATLRSSGGSQVQVGSSDQPAQRTRSNPPKAPVAGCPASQLTGSFDHHLDGGLVGRDADDDGTTLVLTNHGSTPCAVGGTPSIAFVGPYISGGFSPLAGPVPTRVILAPGASAASTLRWSTTSGTCSTPSSLTVAPSGVGGGLDVAWHDGEVCLGGQEKAAAGSLVAAGSPPTSDAGPSASGLCTTAQLEFVYLPGGSSPASDPAVYSFEVVNVSNQTCITGDYPGASVSDASGSPLMVSTGRTDLGGGPTSITLVPGAVASFALTLPNQPGASCTAIGAFHFIAPDDTVPTAVSVAGAGLQECGGATGTSSVGAIHLGLAFALQQAAR